MDHKVFTPDDPALPMNYPGFVFRALRERGLSESSLLADTGLTEEKLRDPHFRCGFQPLRRFFLNALEQTADPHLGVSLALKFDPSYIGLPSYAATNAASLQDGLEVLEKFFHLTFPAFEFKLINQYSSLTADEAAVRMRSKFPFYELEYFAFCSAIVVIDRLLSSMLRVAQVATRAETIVSARPDWPSAAANINMSVRFQAAENLIIFPRRMLSQTLPGADPLNHARIVKICEEFASQVSFDATPVSQVISVLESVNSLNVPLSAVAAELGYSERGLRRRLDQSGTSYRELTDQLRERRARELLAGGTQPIKSIAGALGFESASNFARSFKRWTGMTPKAFRERAFDRGGPGRK